MKTLGGGDATTGRTCRPGTLSMDGNPRFQTWLTENDWVSVKKVRVMRVYLGPNFGAMLRLKWPFSHIAHWADRWQYSRAKKNYSRKSAMFDLPNLLGPTEAVDLYPSIAPATRQGLPRIVAVAARKGTMKKYPLQGPAVHGLQEHAFQTEIQFGVEHGQLCRIACWNRSSAELDYWKYSRLGRNCRLTSLQASSSKA